MTGVLILGAGGHAKVVADILLSQGLEVTGYLDDDPQTWNTKPLNVPVLGSSDTFPELAQHRIVIGIGSNAIRQRLAAQLGEDMRWCNALHPRAIIAESVKLGLGVVVAAGAIINPDTVIGDHVIINTAASVDHDCEVGAFCHIGPGTHLGGGVKVGQGTLIGIGATVHPYCTIGKNVIVGAGAVVVNDIPDNITVVGVPARPLKKD